MIHLIYTEFYRNKAGRGDYIAGVGNSPLGCCGAVALQHLSIASETTVTECKEVLQWFDMNRKRYRGLIAIPIQQSSKEDDSASIDRYHELWVQPAIDLGWDTLGEPWLNPNTGRILQMYYKDFK